MLLWSVCKEQLSTERFLWPVPDGGESVQASETHCFHVFYIHPSLLGASVADTRDFIPYSFYWMRPFLSWKSAWGMDSSIFPTWNSHYHRHRFRNWDDISIIYVLIADNAQGRTNVYNYLKMRFVGIVNKIFLQCISCELPLPSSEIKCHAFLNMLPSRWTYQEFSGLNSIQISITFHKLLCTLAFHERNYWTVSIHCIRVVWAINIGILNQTVSVFKENFCAELQVRRLQTFEFFEIIFIQSLFSCWTPPSIFRFVFKTKPFSHPTLTRIQPWRLCSSFRPIISVPTFHQRVVFISCNLTVPEKMDGNWRMAMDQRCIVPFFRLLVHPLCHRITVAQIADNSWCLCFIRSHRVR